MNEEDRTHARELARKIWRLTKAGKRTESVDVMGLCALMEKTLNSLTAAEEQLLYLEQHPPGCECRDCRIP